MSLNERSLKNLQGVHPHLQSVVQLAATKVDFIVTEGRRTLERQKLLVANHKSKTLNSRHLTGHAIDFADPDGHYDEPDMERIGAAFKEASRELSVPIDWGGDWGRKNGKLGWDSPHIQLTHKAYPASGISTTAKIAEALKTKPAVATVSVSGGAVATAPALPAPPDLSNLEAWKTTGETVSSLADWAFSNWWITALLLVYLGAVSIGPKLLGRAPA